MNLDSLRIQLRDRQGVDDEHAWPAASLELLSDAGCWGKVIAADYGGSAVAPVDQLATYEAVAAGSLTMALILTQHDGACELIADCDNQDLARRVLPKCADGSCLATVGISQLTTSRRTAGPGMRVATVGHGFHLTGLMPWVTAARHADYIVTGGVLPDGDQILTLVETDAPGLTVAEPMAFVALSASFTSEVRCDGVDVGQDHLMRGPVDRVLALRAPVKPLSVSAVGIGVAGALLEAVRERTPMLPQASDLLSGTIPERFDAVRQRLFDAADALDDPDAEIPAMDIRVAVNDLIMRLATTYLTLAKGSGYLSTHPAQRLFREAMFFLVWSAPPHVQSGTLDLVWT